MFFKKNKQIEELKEKEEQSMFLGKPMIYWIEIEYKIQKIDIANLLPHCVLENIELKKACVKLKQENKLLQEAVNKIINGDENE